MAYVTGTKDDVKKNLMKECEKLVSGMVDNPNIGYGLTSTNDYLLIILRTPKQ